MNLDDMALSALDGRPASLADVRRAYLSATSGFAGVAFVFDGSVEVNSPGF